MVGNNTNCNNCRFNIKSFGRHFQIQGTFLVHAFNGNRFHDHGAADTMLYYMNYRKIQLHKFTRFSTCSKSQDTLPLISPKICNHHWKINDFGLPCHYRALYVWRALNGSSWSLTVCRCLAAGQWHTENQRDT